MAYALHIKRDSPILLSEWQDAISSIDGVKIDNSDIEAKNPNTGELITISANEGDVLVLFKSKGFLGLFNKFSWEHAISFSNGRASFKATEDIDSIDNPVHKAVAKISAKLNAQIIGDEGEIYQW